MSLKLACVGTSSITAQTLAAVSKISEIEAYAIYSRELGKAKAFNLTKAYDDYALMLANPKIDVVYIASPNILHFKHAKQALLAGKHVVLEKPFVQTYAEAEELFECAENHDCLLFEAITTIHNVNFRHIKNNYQALGPIRHFYANYSQYSARYTKYLAGEISNIFNPAYAGGALGDINIYNVHLALGLFGRPQELKYYPNRGFNGVDSSGVVVLSYPGFHALCFGAKDCDGENGIYLQGEQGHLSAKPESRYLGEVTSNVNSLVCPWPELEDRLESEWRDFVTAISNPAESDYEHWKAHTLLVADVYEKLKVEN